MGAHAPRSRCLPALSFSASPCLSPGALLPTAPTALSLINLISYVFFLFNLQERDGHDEQLCVSSEDPPPPDNKCVYLVPSSMALLEGWRPGLAALRSRL
jgi:hypothetical protein